MRDSLGSECLFGLAQVGPRNPANRSQCSVAGRETISHQAKTIKKRKITMEIHPKEAEIISFVLSRVKQLISIWLKEEIVEKLSGSGSHGSWWIHLQGRWIFTIYKSVRGSHLQTLPPFLRGYRWKGNAGSAERIPVSIGNKKINHDVMSDAFCPRL